MRLSITVRRYNEKDPRKKILFVDSPFDSRLPLNKFLEIMERAYNIQFGDEFTAFRITEFIINGNEFQLNTPGYKRDRPIGKLFRDGEQFTLVGVFVPRNLVLSKIRH
jgi:hypothetical protein